MAQPEKIIKKDVQNLWQVNDFKIINETWDKHILSDGTTLRARAILAGVMLEKSLDELEARIRVGEKPKLGLNFRTRNFFEIDSPSELRGQPEKKAYSNEELKKSITEKDIDFKTVQQAWNVYETTNGIILKLRISIVSVNKTSKFDERGMPVYFVESGIELKTEIPERLKKLSQNMPDQGVLTFKPIT